MVLTIMTAKEYRDRFPRMFGWTHTIGVILLYCGANHVHLMIFQCLQLFVDRLIFSRAQQMQIRILTYLHHILHHVSLSFYTRQSTRRQLPVFFITTVLRYTMFPRKTMFWLSLFFPSLATPEHDEIILVNANRPLAF